MLVNDLRKAVGRHDRRLTLLVRDVGPFDAGAASVAFFIARPWASFYNPEES